MSKKSQEILSKYWGYSEFRPMQEEIIEASIYGKDVIALLPTGGGKSICFQVPGIAREGITIVVSPLIALMEDQVNQLQKRGIRAKALTSGLSFREIDILLDNAKFGGIDFLYISPERIQTRLFQERVKQMEIALFVVDEAHCISEWGHDFRPAYMEISKLREYHPEVPIIAVTATATPKVKEDIASHLKLKNPEIFEASFERTNVSYEVYPVSNKLDAIAKWILKNPNDVGIIYCQTRKSVKDVMIYLQALKIKANMYHGGMNGKERSLALTNWLSEHTPIMVATNAFGMGIDKPNVRFVSHYEIPNNPESYFQEAGRAGRDGNESRTFAFVEPVDLNEIAVRVMAQFPSPDKIRLIYRALCNYLKVAIGSGEHESYILLFKDFVKKFNLNMAEVYPAFRLLEMNGSILFSEQGLKGSRIKISIDNTHLYGFQLKNPVLDPLITWISRNHSEVFDSFCEIDEEEACKRLKISNQELERQLKYLEEHGIIDITWRTDLPMITFLHERLPDDYIELKPEVYHFRKERALERMNVMKAYIEGRHCRPQFIIAYFGQTSIPCGKCDYCLEQRLLEKHPRLELELIELLEQKPMTLAEIVSQFDASFATKIKSILKELINQERVTFSEMYFSLPQ
ncbi:RecQ family ATP-dependent DNA helicase [Fluviicola taffensis]|uniref:ATP-dependent DNA helicase RecQ n=1 Tax=Fluviicola taffensis (strain DSM 16823 / NCIMB 13979 / RW262) TaxID=755732 RepID=F2IDY6_FLUTR|nr:ATP-dependent DNA helicase RecQ [Fluviicola taffensis]AEA45550.1 ATP-dependent DNA helicase, RecQ family [Fluviicola taffensis DSM 16823]